MQGGSGYAKNIKFQNIIMHNVTNPIIVDQNYCDRKEACPEQVTTLHHVTHSLFIDMILKLISFLFC